MPGPPSVECGCRGFGRPSILSTLRMTGSGSPLMPVDDGGYAVRGRRETRCASAPVSEGDDAAAARPAVVIATPSRKSRRVILRPPSAASAMPCPLVEVPRPDALGPAGPRQEDETRETARAGRRIVQRSDSGETGPDLGLESLEVRPELAEVLRVRLEHEVVHAGLRVLGEPGGDGVRVALEHRAPGRALVGGREPVAAERDPDAQRDLEVPAGRPLGEPL